MSSYRTTEELLESIRYLRLSISQGFRPGDTSIRKTRNSEEQRAIKVIRWLQTKGWDLNRTLLTTDDTKGPFWDQVLKSIDFSGRERHVTNYTKLAHRLLGDPGFDSKTGALTAVGRVPQSTLKSPEGPLAKVSIPSVRVIRPTVEHEKVTTLPTARSVLSAMSKENPDTFNEAVMEFASPYIIMEKLIQYSQAAEKTIDSLELSNSVLAEEIVQLKRTLVETQDWNKALEEDLAKAPKPEVLKPTGNGMGFGFLRRGSGVDR